MIVKVILLAALIAILLYALSQRRRVFGISAGMALLSLIGVLFVISPELANSIAHFVGVGRGADLVLYCFVILMLAAVLNIHLRLRSEHETLTKLAREIALLSAQRREEKR